MVPSSASTSEALDILCCHASGDGRRAETRRARSASHASASVISIPSRTACPGAASLLTLDGPSMALTLVKSQMLGQETRIRP
jgi:hypothetical protein